MIISYNVEFLKYKPVSFLQLIHLIDMASTLSISSIKFNSNMEKHLIMKELDLYLDLEYLHYVP